MWCYARVIQGLSCLATAIAFLKCHRRNAYWEIQKVQLPNQKRHHHCWFTRVSEQLKPTVMMIIIQCPEVLMIGTIYMIYMTMVLSKVKRVRKQHITVHHYMQNSFKEWIVSRWWLLLHTNCASKTSLRSLVHSWSHALHN